MERKCSTLILNDDLSCSSPLSNMTIIQINSKNIPRIYEAISAVDLPLIKPIQLSTSSIVVCTIIVGLFVTFLFILSISFDVYTQSPRFLYKMRHPISKNEINSLFPSKHLPAPSHEECPICMNKLSNSIRILACGHCFHTTCIDQWIVEYKAQCPICKAIVWKCNTSA